MEFTYLFDRSPRLAGGWALLAAALLALGASAASAAWPPKAPEVAWRQIGVKFIPTEPCPVPAGGNWAASQLFPGPMTGGQLDRFCLYEFIGSRVYRSDVDLLQGLHLEMVGPDAAAVLPQGMGLKGQIRGALAVELGSQGGKFSGGDVPVLHGSPVRLALLDTSPNPGMNPFGLMEHSPHGWNLQRIGRYLACPTSGPCALQIVPRLTMAYLYIHPERPGATVRDDVQGGYFGTLSDLASAVHQEVRSWMLNTTGEPLVINLSLGWDGLAFGGTETSEGLMPPAVRAVYAALDDAACRGAVTVAAAGNMGSHRIGGAGPLMPAGWETFAASCSTGDIYKPIVYSVSAVDDEELPLGNTRFGSRGPLTAFGDHAIPPVSGPRAATLTGSSVAALVGSVSVAATWHHFPHLDGRLLMDAVYSAGRDLGVGPDFLLRLELGPPTPARNSIRKLSVCGVLTEVCLALEGCPTLPTCPAWVPESTNLRPNLSGATLPSISAASVSTPLSAVPVCAGADPLYDLTDGPPKDPCPQLQYLGHADTLWLYPQPGSDPCPNCIYQAGPDRLLIEIDPDYVGSLESPTVLACGTSHALPKPSKALAAGDSLTVEDLDLGTCGSASLVFARRGGGSTLSPIKMSD
ncbi:MAG: S8/S53 family peptidase [Acidobacteriota bacterium]